MKLGISKPRDISITDYFSKSCSIQNTSITEWELQEVISLTSQQLKSIANQIIKRNHSLVFSSDQRFFSGESSEILEKISILSELEEHFPHSALLLRFRPELENSLRKCAPLFSDKKITLWMDAGRELPSNDLIEKSRELCIEWIADPFWHSKKFVKSSCIYKVHGWHPERWIRYYGKEQLEQLRTLCQKNDPKVLLFAHSMRNEEVTRFQEINGID
jgi:hypothetical protein